MVSRLSASSRQLARDLRIRRIIVGTKRVPLVTNLINWGCSEIPGIREGTNVLNEPSAVKAAVDKLTTFATLKAENIPVVEFTDSPIEALKWLQGGTTVYGRKLTRGSGGEGIHLFHPIDPIPKELPKYPLYTKFWKSEREFRAHVFQSEVIDFAEKRRLRVDNPPKDRYWIRTRENGWIYARTDAQLPDKVKTHCVAAVRALDLDFGAVDVRVRNNGECRILEINSAPGLEGQTLTSYHQAFWRYINGRD